MHPKFSSVVWFVVFALVALGGSPGAGAQTASPGYADLVALFDEFREARTPEPWSAAFDDPDAPWGVSDHGAAAIAERRARVEAIEATLKSICAFTAR